MDGNGNVAAARLNYHERHLVKHDEEFKDVWSNMNDLKEGVNQMKGGIKILVWLAGGGLVGTLTLLADKFA